MKGENIEGRNEIQANPELEKEKTMAASVEMAPTQMHVRGGGGASSPFFLFWSFSCGGDDLGAAWEMMEIDKG